MHQVTLTVDLSSFPTKAELPEPQQQAAGTPLATGGASPRLLTPVIHDELVHAPRPQRGAHGLGDHLAGIDVADELRDPLRGVGALLQQDNRCWLGGEHTAGLVLPSQCSGAAQHDPTVQRGRGQNLQTPQTPLPRAPARQFLTLLLQSGAQSPSMG